MTFLKLGITASLVTLLAACGGGGSSTSAPQENNDNPSTVNDPVASSQNEESISETALFPAAGPLVDPASTREEIASRADALLVEYETLLPEVLRQMGDVYQTLQNGSESSSDPGILAMDVQFFDEITRGGLCTPQFDADGILNGVMDCNRNTSNFAFRHPQYENTVIRVRDYRPDINFEAGDESNTFIRGTQADGDTSINAANNLRIMTEINFLGVPTLTLEIPAFIGDVCIVSLSPTRFEDNLGINECSALLQTAITVLQRLNNR